MGHVILLYGHDINYDEIIQLIGEPVVVVPFECIFGSRHCNCIVSISDMMVAWE